MPIPCTRGRGHLVHAQGLLNNAVAGGGVHHVLITARHYPETPKHTHMQIVAGSNAGPQFVCTRSQPPILMCILLMQGLSTLHDYTNLVPCMWRVRGLEQVMSLLHPMLKQVLTSCNSRELSACSDLVEWKVCRTTLYEQMDAM